MSETFIESGKAAGFCQLRGIPVLVLAVGVLLARPAAADLNSEISELYGALSNTTRPGAYETERRGVISGGDLTVRAPVKSLDPVTVTLPHAGAGCSGIDLYGGSFSYINREEFISFMRTVAANAQGYAFEIALSAICEKCAQEMEVLQRKVQELNQYFGNSCQLAQGVVNDSLAAFGRKGLTDASLIGQFEGMGDLYELSSVRDAGEVYRKARDSGSGEAARLTGNIMWQSLMDNGFFAANPEIAEAVMSMTGTVIVSRDGRKISVAPGGIIGLQDLIEGGEVAVYRCDSRKRDGCATVTRQQVRIRGLGYLVAEQLVGDNGQGGIVEKFARNKGRLTAREVGILNSLNPGIPAMIRTLSARNQGAAAEFSRGIAYAAALDLAGRYVNSWLDSAGGLIRENPGAFSGILREQLSGVQQKTSSERLTLLRKYGTDREIRALYGYYLQDTGTGQYMPGQFVYGREKP
ncbi:conjugal transfer protein TraH [Succinimonas amylolytica]|uniref:conjugal transfer protein TraH n=1 Tax=Succinimonas amylolytica TaxID=83769 RepID=UPI00037FD8AA|nr:conjugal transfer protein TraH [Succinimonas amylolytica]